MNNSTIIDPQLLGATSQQQLRPLTVQSRNADAPGAPPTQTQLGNEAPIEKRKKLNLLKCNQCRDARKKCFPVDRVWPQKCLRCLQHKPEPLECSEPRTNERKRGKSRAKLQAERAKTLSASENDKSKSPRPTEDSDEESSGDEPEPEVIDAFRPAPTAVYKRGGIKREVKTDQPVVGDNPGLAFLHLGERQFRILRLESGRKYSRVVYSFQTATIGEKRDYEYETVSYLWAGGVKQNEKVEIRDQNGHPHPFFIRSHLYAALRRLRHPKDVKCFWIDALCINHTRVEEKSHQVGLKKEIFEGARNLCFWLGEDEDGVAALNFLPRILDLEHIDSLVTDEAAIPGWTSFLTLLHNPIFSRLWLVQEVAVAKNVTLHCGKEAKHYTDFVVAVAIFVSFQTKISILFHSKDKDNDLADRKTTSVERFIDVTTYALRKPGFGTMPQLLLSVETLVSELSELGVSNPLDRIYAVLGLAKDAEDLMMRAEKKTDYEKTVLEIYQRFVVHAVKRSKSLDIICRRWASGDLDPNLPTWIRPLQSSRAPTSNTSTSERVDADSLVGLPDRKWYNASRGEMDTTERQELVAPEEKQSLSVKGFRVDTISKLESGALDGIIAYEWFTLGGCEIRDDGDVVPEAFWRTIVADRGPNGSHAPSWYQRALLYCLAHSTNGNIDTKKLVADCKEAGSSLVVDFLLRVQSVIWNRKFFQTEGKFIGLAPMAAQTGDIICILYGCSVPVVLRKAQDEASDTYALVGECYVHSIMDGEAMEKSAKYIEHEQKFNII